MRQNETLEELTPRQRRALRFILTQPNLSAAAERAGLSRRTLHRWLADENFQQALEQIGSASQAALAAGLVQLTTEAVESLRQLLKNPNPWVQLEAVELILNTRQKAVEIRDVQQWLEAISEDLEDLRVQVEELHLSQLLDQLLERSEGQKDSPQFIEKIRAYVEVEREATS